VQPPSIFIARVMTPSCMPVIIIQARFLLALVITSA
jgi:hypothetical protein